MDPGRVVLDISSDEEQGWSEPKSDDFDWLSELLDDVDKQTGEDSDEVVVVGEVNPKPRSKSSRQTTVKDVDDDDDDECVVLDGDPDKPVEAAKDDTASGGSDELVIVGEKGQIACRDYPHPRHLCASFPFSTTPHKNYCKQCHCYVCDLVAPCVNWGSGISSTDHCHATDKEETWKIQRRNFNNLGKNATLPASKISDTSLTISLPQINQVAPLNIICLSPSPRQQNQVSRPPVVRPCTSSNFSVPNIISQDRSHQPGFATNKNRFHPRLLSRQIPTFGAQNNNLRRSKLHHRGHFEPRFPHPPTLVKRPRHFGVSLPMSQSIYSPSNGDGFANPLQYGSNHTTMAMSNDLQCGSNHTTMAMSNDLQCGSNHTTMTMSNDINTFRMEDVSSSMNQTTSQPNLASLVGNTLPSQTQIYSQNVPVSNHSQDLYSNGNQILNPLSTHGQNDYANGSQIQNHGQSVFQYGHLCETASQNLSLESSQVASSTTDMGFLDYNYDWVNNTSQGNQQGHVEHSQVQNTEPVYEPSVARESTLIQGNNIHAGAFDIENWLMDNQSVPVTSGGSVPSLNILSPEPPLDAGMLLFDFETSWNGLARV